jgi:hypothetical protein
MESIGELIEKLVIANIKLWMVKDAQTLIACRDPVPLQELRDQLALLGRSDSGAESLASLRQLLDRLTELARLDNHQVLEQLRQLVAKDIALCEARAAYRREIDQRLGDRTAVDTVKLYGPRS